ncbi:uncharacterized protein [Pagrus major]|uniref:uncharacterized protein n=1 Tax=Pagrus major TaxID=143350 RepID=UPI003CC88E8E
MSKVQTLRVFVKQRLTAAAEEIFELFERTIAEYEEELGRHRKLLDAVFKPQVQLHRADVQQLSGSEEEDPPEQQEWSSSLDQEDPPELPHIKEEQEELWTSQEGEQLGGLEKADNTKFTFTPDPVKSEEDDDDDDLKAEADGEDCGGPESVSNFNPISHDKTLHSSEPESDGSSDWRETREPQQNNEASGSDTDCNTETRSVISAECSSSFDHKGHLQKQDETGVKPFSCSICGKRYGGNHSLKGHMRLHSEGKHFSCPVCTKTFAWRAGLESHMRIHTGEKPFSCSFCGTGFAQRSTLTSHLRVHTGEKPFTCSVCSKGFCNSSTLIKHMRVHTGEKPFSCSVCGKTFARKAHMRQHLIVHTEEKPFGCSVCGQRFTQHGSLRRHMVVHTGDTTELKNTSLL